MNATVVSRRIVQVLLPTVLDWLLSKITPEMLYQFKQAIYKAGTKVTAKIPGTLDDALWERTAGLVLFEGTFKDNEAKLIDAIEHYALEKDRDGNSVVKDETFRTILLALVKRLREVVEEGNDPTRAPEIEYDNDNEVC